MRWRISGKSSPVKPNKLKFPKGFSIVIDTRESGDYLFSKPPKGLYVVRQKLEVGDYSVAGFTDKIVVEVKRIPDLFQSCGKGHEEFKKRLETMSLYERRWLLVRGAEEDCDRWCEFSLTHPNVVKGTLDSIQGKLFVPVVFKPTRHSAEDWILRVFLKYWEFVHEDRNKNRNNNRNGNRNDDGNGNQNDD